MIRNNQKLGAEVISKMIEMGTGDIKVSVATSKEGNYTSVCFKQDVKGDIGRKEGNTIGVTTDADTPDTMLLFTDVKSIDVVMDKLKKAKIILRNL